MSIEIKKTQTNVEMTLDLAEAFGVKEFPNDESLRLAIGQAIIDQMRDRTKDGVDVMNRPFKKPYSKTYQESAEFEAYGKSPSDVNMTLTGDMLGLMDIKKTSRNKITIGWSDQEQNEKAFNHTTGDTVPKRDFFGINKKELASIVSGFRDEVAGFAEAQKTKREIDRESAAMALLRKVLRGKS